MINFKSLSTVTMFVGLPGSGKTTIAASLVKYANKHNIKAFSNVPIKGSYIYDWNKDFGIYQNLEKSLLVMDEAGLTADNRAWDKNFTPERVQFLKLLRHYGSKLCVFSQTWNDCDIKIRSMTGKLFIVRKSIIPFCTSCIPVFRKIDVNGETKEFKELYYKDHIFARIFSTKRIFRPAYYSLFDSWDAPRLKEKEFKKYEEV